MSVDFDKRLPRFFIGPHDRVTIRGKRFKLGYAREDSFVLSPADGDGPPETFTFAHLNRLNATGKVTHEREYFLPQKLRTHNVLQPEISLSILIKKQRERLNVKYAMVQALLGSARRRLHAGR